MATKKTTELQPKFDMPKEVHDWIENANSKIQQQASRLVYLQGKITALEADIKDLKAYKQWASKRLTQSDIGN